MCFFGHHRSQNKISLIISTCALATDDAKIQSVTLGTGPGGFVKSRKTTRGFVLYGRGDEIEFAIETDERDYSQLSISRRNIR